MKMYANRVETCLYGHDADAERFCLEDLKLVVPSANEPYRHTLRVCPTCGQLEWMSSKPAFQEGFKLDYQQEPGCAAVNCSDCGKAFQRSPELFSTMRNAISHALLLERRKEIENG